jgi:hypothetical protein
MPLVCPGSEELNRKVSGSGGVKFLSTAGAIMQRISATITSNAKLHSVAIFYTFVLYSEQLPKTHLSPVAHIAPDLFALRVS